MQLERPLEVNFVDVGQGDGCHIVTPDDEHFLIDAGEGKNMFRYLKWRFNLQTAKTCAPPFTVVITHPDQDHYKGFEEVFPNSLTPEEKKALDEALKAGTVKESKSKSSSKSKYKLSQKLIISRIFHNGIVEGTPKDAGKEKEKHVVDDTKDTKKKKKPEYKELKTLGNLVFVDDRPRYITGLCDTDEQYQERVNQVVPGGVFIRTLNKSHAPKFSLRQDEKPFYDNPKCHMKMEVMAPLWEMVDGKPALPVLGSSSVSKTKNGNSVVIKLTIGHLRLLLGGDLNTEAEYNLIKFYSGIDISAIKEQLKDETLSDDERKRLNDEIEKAIHLTRNALEVDIAKSCHHGSADFSSEFLQVMNPIATIISSGDEEPHCHPRPDTLGTIGKYSRGKRSLIFSTELARSGKEFLELKDLDLSEQKKKERVVTVYGMINVRTDGEKVIIAQKLESAAKGRNWDIHRMEWKEELGQFEYISDKES